MHEIIALTIELQAMLVGGYIAYKVGVMGRAVEDRTEDLILKVLAFGLFGKALATLLTNSILLAWPAKWLNELLSATSIAAIIEVAFTLALGLFWRLFGYKWISKVMGYFDVYRDDHESSVWMSIAHSGAVFNHVQIHASDGRVLESNFNVLPRNLPSNAIVLNNDGVLVYITKIYRPDCTTVEFSDVVEGNYSTPTFIPRANIVQLDICWRSKR